jgi:hypothetical protein
VLGWLALALLLGFGACVHHGVGPPKPGEPRWYSPRGFLLQSEATAPLFATRGLAFAALGLPALALAAAATVGTGSALATALALSSLMAVLLFTFYGVVAPFPWEFFGWRGSAVLCLVAVSVGFALAAPWLAKSWLELRLTARAAAAAPFVAAAILFLRNATGTDPSLPWAISPWPAVPVFGLEVAALWIATLLCGAALGSWWIARAGADGRARATFSGMALGAATPLALLSAGGALGLFPFRVNAALLVPIGAACALAILAAARLGVRDAGSLPARARALRVAAALVGVPLVVGQAWAWSDYYRSREIRAREIIDALGAFVEQQSLYPDSLDELVEAKLIERIPRPVVGFRFLDDSEFEYESYGTSYLLEFMATRWVQCAYSPAPLLEDLDEEERAELAADGGLEESWSCPSKPPELW